MMNNATTMGNGSLATLEGGEQTLVLLLAAREARNVQTRAQEDAAIDAEDVLTQAEEANGFDPVG